MKRLTSEDALLSAALESPELAPFAMFELDLGAAIDPQTGEPMFPELKGKHTPLWEVRSNLSSPTLERDERAAQAEAHQRRVEEYANRVANGQSVFGDDDPTDEGCDLTPSDEWDDFWRGHTPTVVGRTPRSPEEGGRVLVRVDD